MYLKPGVVAHGQSQYLEGEGKEDPEYKASTFWGKNIGIQYTLKVVYKLFKAQSIYSLSLKKHSTILIQLKIIVTNVTYFIAYIHINL